MAIRRLHKVCFDPDAYDALTLFLLITWPGNAAIEARVDGHLAGFIAGDWPLGDRYGWIVTLSVLPTFRRRGIGARLLAECESRLDRPVLRLMVRESNAPAIKLYVKFGYARVRRQASYYADGEAGLLMEKRR